MSEKLQKLLATAGLGSRRELEKWIAGGRVSVNGAVATLGDRAESDDRILVDGRAIKIVTDDTPRVLMYSKPEGEVCTTVDPDGRPTVFDNLHQTHYIILMAMILIQVDYCSLQRMASLPIA